jgi:isopentenyl-diphosphate delta-isomerase
MKKVTTTSQRKTDHIRINLEENVDSSQTTGLERFSFLHEALPDFNLSDVSLETKFLKKPLQAPLLISSMTGGTDDAMRINRNLAKAAQTTGIAMGVGSQRAALETPDLAKTFQIRDIAPDILLFANLGAIQLNHGNDVEDCFEAVEMIQADALILHLNPLQEAVQPEGNTNFAGLLDTIEHVCTAIPVPVIVKEVGWGISGETAKRLVDVGVAVIDVAGAGGTSWSQVEMYRAETESQAKIAASFIDWGIPTADSILMVKETTPNTPIIASGGLRSGVDIAKTIALGASLGGMAGPFIKAANVSSEKVSEVIETVNKQLQISMFAAGVQNIPQLKETPLRTNPSR